MIFLENNNYIICWNCYETWVVGHMDWIALECQLCNYEIKNHTLNRMVWKWCTKNLT